MHFWLACLVAAFVTVTTRVNVVHAWLPGQHRQIVSRGDGGGVDLFRPQHHHDTSSSSSSSSSSKRFFPSTYGNAAKKIRGVNLGSLFVMENWMADDIMAGWGCDSTSEFDCVSSLHNQTRANTDFAHHWATWVDAADFQRMVAYGLNTVRIPVGYWFYEHIVQRGSEHFPEGGAVYLDKVVGYARDAGMYVIIDLHGAPGAQTTDADTGQDNPDPAFYSAYNYGRANQFFEWLTTKIHTDAAYGTVGMVMLVNEPERLTDDDEYPAAESHAASLASTYYPGAIAQIRVVEATLGVKADNALHIQMMAENWGSGDPIAKITNDTFLAYDDHAYIQYQTGLRQTKAGYLDFSCSGLDRSAEMPVIVGEWSLSVNTTLSWTDDWDPTKKDNVAWYRQWWAAQVVAYEQVAGWVFWTWKTSGSLDDPRWDYQMAVAAGIIPTDIEQAYSMAPCKGVANTTVNIPGNMTKKGEGESIGSMRCSWMLPVAITALGMWYR